MGQVKVGLVQPGGHREHVHEINGFLNLGSHMTFSLYIECTVSPEEIGDAFAQDLAISFVASAQNQICVLACCHNLCLSEAARRDAKAELTSPGKSF